MIELGGRAYVTATEAGQRLGVRPNLCREWASMGVVRRWLVGRTAYFDLDQLEDVECGLRRAGRGRRRSVVHSQPSGVLPDAAQGHGTA